MESPQVLLSRGEDGLFRLVGRIVARQERVLTVMLADGTTTTRELGTGEITPVEGSLSHLLRLAPQAVELTLINAPERIYKQILFESSRPLNARQLKEKLSQLPQSVVDSSWRRAKKALDSDADVERQGKNQSSYSLRSSHSRDLLDLLPREPGSLASPDPLPPSSARAEAMSRSNSSPTPGTVPGGSAAETADGTSAQDHFPSAAAEPDTLVSRLNDRFPEIRLESREDVLERPLTVAVALRTLTKVGRQDVGEGLNDAETDLLHLLSPSESEGTAHALDDRGRRTLATLQEAAARELLGTVTDSKARSAFLTLVERGSAAKALSVNALAQGAVHLARQAAPGQQLGRCLRLLADAVDSEDVARLEEWDFISLSKASCSIPIDRDGGRSRLLVSLYRRLPEEVRKQRWWDRTSVTELADAARGPLGLALDDEWVSATVVAPVVAQMISETTSRSGLAAAWGLPWQLARHIDGPRMSRLVARVAATDDITGAWLREMANAQTVAGLQRKVETMTRDVEQARGAEKDARRQADRLSEQLQRSAAQVAAARSADLSDRNSRDRQIRLDLLRALALVAAQVLQSEVARADTALVGQVTHACRSEGLDGFNEPGQEVEYDPERHQTLTPNLSAGSAARVLRGGYTWTHDGNRVVLLKAQVVAV